MPRFDYLHNKFISKYEIVNNGLVWEVVETKQDAESIVNTLNNCDHPNLDRPEWVNSATLGGNKEILIGCLFCGATAYVPIPVNLEWSD